MIPILRLTILDPPSGPADMRTRTLSEGVLKIGRGADNDWVIEGGRLTLEEHHCFIRGAGGIFSVTDTSSAGVLLNDAERPLGRGRSAALGPGDRLQLGGTVISVTIASEDAPDGPHFTAVLPAYAGRSGFTPDLAARPAHRPVQGFPVQLPSFSSPAQSARNEPALWDLPRRNLRPQEIAPDRAPPQHDVFVPPPVPAPTIPENWDQDGAEPQASPIPAREPEGLRRLALALIESLARLEAKADPADPPLLGGRPDEALDRLLSSDPGWTELELGDLTARIIQKLKAVAAASPPGPPDASPPRSNAPAQGDDER